VPGEHLADGVELERLDRERASTLRHAAKV
jgi:hypothetical protein